MFSNHCRALCNLTDVNVLCKKGTLLAFWCKLNLQINTMLKGFVMLTFQLVCFGEETCTLIFKGLLLWSWLFFLKSTLILRRKKYLKAVTRIASNILYIHRRIGCSVENDLMVKYYYRKNIFPGSLILINLTLIWFHPRLVHLIRVDSWICFKREILINCSCISDDESTIFLLG